MSHTWLINENELSAEVFMEILGKLQLDHQFLHTDKILIKPNLTGNAKSPVSNGSVTSLETIESLVAIITLINPSAAIHIVESDSPNGGFAFSKFPSNGYDFLCKKYDKVKLVDLTRSTHAKYLFSGKYFNDSITLSEELNRPYFFISLGKIKTHNKVGYTGALKNQYGCLHQFDKSIFHNALDRVICDINRFIQPDLSILDGCPAMEGNGPLNGTPVETGIMAFSNNPVLLDELISKKTGLYPYAKDYLTYCRTNLSDVYPMENHQIHNKHLLENLPKFKYLSFFQRARNKTSGIILSANSKLRALAERIQI